MQLGIEECKQQLFQDKNDKDAKKAIYILTWLDDPLGDTKVRCKCLYFINTRLAEVHVINRKLRRAVRLARPAA